MTLPAQDIVERLRFHGRYASESQDECTARKNAEREEAADTISRLTADNEALRKDNARLSEEKEALAFGARHGESLSEDAIHAIRELLKAHDVPVAAFIDDHVGNAIAQRDEARAAHHRTSHKAVKRLRALWREKQAAEARADALAQALDDMLLEYGDRYDSECRLKNASELDMIAKARAVLGDRP